MQLVAALTRDDVEDGALHVAVLGRCAELQDFDLFDRVGVGPWRRTDLGPIDVIRVLLVLEPSDVAAVDDPTFDVWLSQARS